MLTLYETGPPRNRFSGNQRSRVPKVDLQIQHRSESRMRSCYVKTRLSGSYIRFRVNREFHEKLADLYHAGELGLETWKTYTDYFINNKTRAIVDNEIIFEITEVLPETVLGE